MDALAVQQAVVPPSAAVAAAGSGVCAVNNAAVDASSLPPQGFGALLALQLGGAVTAKSPAAADARGDEKTAPDDATAGTLAIMPDDALAALNLPALLPAATPVVTTAAPRTLHGAAPVTRGFESAERGPLATARQAALAQDTTIQSAGPSRSGEPVAPRAAAADMPRAGDTAAAQIAALQAVEPNRHAVETAATNALPAAFAHLAAPPALAPAAVGAAIAARVGTPDWNAELGQKIVWMVGDRQQAAEMHVNPPELGPLDIKLTIDGQQTSVVFTSPHSAVREAVESALPRLREVLADSGITLGNASVTSDTPRDGRAYSDDQHQGARTNGRRAADGGTAPAAMQIVRTARGLVDLFA